MFAWIFRFINARLWDDFADVKKLRAIDVKKYFDEGDSPDLLDTKEQAKDIRRVTLLFEKDLNLDGILDWELSSQTNGTRRFLFALFFVLVLASIERTHSGDTALYGIKLSVQSLPFLKDFFTWLIALATTAYVFLFIKDCWIGFAKTGIVEDSLEEGRKILEKWYRDMRKRGVQVSFDDLLRPSQTLRHEEAKRTADFKRTIELYSRHVRGPSVLSKSINLIGFVWPIAAGIVSLYLVNKL